IVERNPKVRATLLDLPGPLAEARRLVAARKMEKRVEFVAADARHYLTNEPFDTVLISNVLHTIGPTGSIELLKHCFQLLLPGGRLIIQAQYLHDDRVSPRWPALLSLILRVVSRDGRNHTVSETKQWMKEAGFRNVHYIRLSV